SGPGSGRSLPGRARGLRSGSCPASSEPAGSGTLAAHLDVAARQVLRPLGCRLAGAVAALRRRPDAPAAEAAVLGLGDPDQRLLRHRVDGVVVDVEAEDIAHRPGLLVEQAVGLVHRRQPIAGDALMRPVAVAGLIARAGRQGATVGPGLVRPDAPLGGDPT